MANWYLNKFLTTWRAAVDAKYPKRSKASDGTKGDPRHAAGVSEHNPDPNGSVDAWDMDLNLLGSSDSDGNAAEDRAVEALKREFQKQPQAQLWIHNGQIANRDVDNWRRRPYHGTNPHDHHVHWQSRASKETQPYAGHLDHVVDAINVKEQEMQLGDKVKLFKNPDVKYSSPETTVGSILASTNYYTLQARNQAARNFSQVKLTLAAILKATQSGADTTKILSHIDSAVDELTAASEARDAELRALIAKAISGEATAEAVLDLIAERLAS